MVGKEPITKTNTGRTANDTPNLSPSLKKITQNFRKLDFKLNSIIFGV